MGHMTRTYVEFNYAENLITFLKPPEASVIFLTSSLRQRYSVFYCFKLGRWRNSVRVNDEGEKKPRIAM